MQTDAKDKSTEIGSPGFKPLDARAVGEPEAVRIGRTTFKQLLGSIQGDLGKSGSTSLCVSNFERRGVRWLLAGNQRNDRLDNEQQPSVQHPASTAPVEHDAGSGRQDLG